MASPRRKTYRRPTFSATEPHFLKIIPEGTSKHSKLMIPRTFFMKCGDELSNPVLLKLPSGAEWKVELRKWDDELWFGKGWPKFFEFYSIGYSYSLVFRYEGNSKFRVCIFDRDSTEIDYPLTIPEMSETDEGDGSDGNTSADDNSRDDSIQIIDDFLLRSRKKEKSKLPYPRNHKKNRTSSIDKVHFRAKRYSQGESNTPNYRKMTQPVGRMNLSLAGGKATALQRAKAFKSGNPSFIVPIYHSYISKNFVWLPSRFSIHMKRLSKNSGAIKLRVLDGRTWSLALQYEKANRQKHKLHYGWREFVQGNNLKVGDVCVLVLTDEIRLTFEVVIFRAIVAANSLSPQEMPEMEETDEDDDPMDMLDDVPPCSKRMKKSPIAPQPHEKETRVFGGSYKTPRRVNPRPEVRSRQKRGKHRALERAKAFKSEHPSCTVFMRHSYIHAHYVKLGVNFIKEHLVNQTREYAILRVSSGRTWPVKLANEEKYNVRFRSGWMTFVQDNQLDIGDVCIFVLIDDIKLLMDVVIFRSREAANCTSSPDSNGEQRMFHIKETDGDDDSIESLDDIPSCAKRRNNPPVAPPKHKRYSIRAKKDTKNFGKPSRIHKLLKQGPEITASENDRALQKAKAFKSDYPSCTVVLRPAYIVGGYLHLKASFTKEHFLKRKQDNVILRALDGRTWPVKLYTQKKTVRFYGGWMSFVQDNHLKVHDVCVFVLINDIELIMDVVIFHAVEAANCTLSPDYDEEQPMSQMKESDEDDDSIEILDDFPSCSRRTNKLPVAPQPQHHKRTEENYNTDRAASSSRTQKLFKRTPAIMSSGKYRALQRAISFKSEYPSCTVVMKSSYIAASYLYLGVRFNEKHLLNRKGDNVILHVDGRTWTVKLGKRNKLVRLQSGWKPFVEENHLEIGDVCVFVLVDDIKLLMDVVLFRAREAENCTSSPDNQHPRSVEVEEVEDELDDDRKMEAEYLTVDTTSESE